MVDTNINIGKRTNFDFSEHELIVEKSEGLLVHTLKHKDYNQMYRFNFINTNGVMVVTGDYGNWMFCREFHPSSDGRVSDYYWCEKIKIASTQEPFEFDHETTEKEIRDGINGGLAEYGYNDNELDQIIEWYEEVLLYNIDESEQIYLSKAYDSMPSFLDYESIPHNTKIKYWLLCVFDAFDEICIRLKSEE